MQRYSLTSMAALLLGLAAVTAACGSDDSNNTPANQDAGADVGSDGAVVGNGCNFGEPNNTRETATTIELNTLYKSVCVSGAGDTADFYEITAPNDAAGGLVELQLSNVSTNGLPQVAVIASSDNGSVFSHYTTDEGSNLNLWFTVAAGAKYKLKVDRFAGDEPRYTYDLNLKYTKINDSFEPNDVKADAKDIVVGTPIQASASGNGPNGGDLPSKAYEDWYKVALGAGASVVTMSNVPADYLCKVTVLDPAGNEVGQNYSTTEGANCKVTLEATAAAGTYYVNVQPFALSPARANYGTTVPDSQTKQYTLLVSAP